MIVIDFFKEIETTWEELQKKALSAIDEFQKGAMNIENGELSPDIQYEDYRQVLKLGLKTFIMQVLNDWKGIEEPILIFKDKFFQRFDNVELDGTLKDTKIPFKFENSKKLFKILKEGKIQVKEEEFEKISSVFEEHNTVATVMTIDYQLFELDEVVDMKYSSDSFKDEYDEDSLDDLEDIL
jgi:hypothetical protein